MTTEGHGDAMLIMRGVGRVAGAPPEDLLLLDRNQQARRRSSARSLVREVSERVDSIGEVVVALDEAGVAATVRELPRRASTRSRSPALVVPEPRARAARCGRSSTRSRRTPSSPVSHELSQVVGEYERTVATVINAFVGPLTSQLPRPARRAARRARLLGRADADAVARRHRAARGRPREPMLTLGSGPVGGMVGSQRLGGELGYADMIATDMGGTSFDVGLVQRRRAAVALEHDVRQVARTAIPTVEVISIGAGGGSIAWIDRTGTVAGRAAQRRLRPRAGLLRARRRPSRRSPTPTWCSATSTPRTSSGRSATELVTPTRARRAACSASASRSARRSTTRPGIGEIADNMMARTCRMPWSRGFDPRDFVVFAFGGAGPVHAGAYARELGFRRSSSPGGRLGLERFGTLCRTSLPRRSRRRAALAVRPGVMKRRSTSSKRNCSRLAGERERAGAAVQIRRLARMRYEWQRNELEVDLPLGDLDEAALAAATGAFESAYGERYGSAALLPGARLEITSLRAEVLIPVGASKAARQTGRGVAGRKPTRLVAFERGAEPAPTTVYDGNGSRRPGRPRPGVIDLPTTGIVVPAGAKVTRAPPATSS